MTKARLLLSAVLLTLAFGVTACASPTDPGHTLGPNTHTLGPNT